MPTVELMSYFVTYVFKLCIFCSKHTRLGSEPANHRLQKQQRPEKTTMGGYC